MQVSLIKLLLLSIKWTSVFSSNLNKEYMPVSSQSLSQSESFRSQSSVAEYGSKQYPSDNSKYQALSVQSQSDYQRQLYQFQPRSTILPDPTSRSSSLQVDVDDSPTLYTFSYTGNYQTFYVPPGVTSLTVHAYGAQGANTPYCLGGTGGYIATTVSVAPNTYLYVYVGGAGSSSNGGYNGGGGGGAIYGEGGGGGGGTDIRTSVGDLDSRIVVAGGGGGAGWNDNFFFIDGGSGGGLTGLSGSADSASPISYGGGGGAQDSGGSGGLYYYGYPYGSDGSFGNGGDGGGNTAGGGGGGGYFGGGGGSWTGGGGGSSYSSGSISINSQAYWSGNGFLRIRIPPGDSVPTAAPGKNECVEAILWCVNK